MVGWECPTTPREASGPDPEAVHERAATELGVDPASCIVVEDSKNGVEAAVRAGTYCIAYRVDHNADRDLSRADAVVDGPAALRAALVGDA